MVHSLPRSLLTRLAQTAPVVIGSVALHVGVAMALVGGAGGHARASVTLPVTALDVDVAAEAPTLEPVRDEAPLPPEADRDHEPVPTHTHTYPVAPSHDARPHDPSLPHDDAPKTTVTDDHMHEAEPAQAAPAQVAAPTEATALPRFSIPSGAGQSASVHVSASGVSSGAGPAAGAAAGSGGDDVIALASTVQVSAKLVQSVVAAYPAGARSDDVEGDVGVEIVVDREGRVVEARVSRPAGHGFDDAALGAVRRYRFTPAQRDGHTVRVRMPWSVHFRLR